MAHSNSKVLSEIDTKAVECCICGSYCSISPILILPQGLQCGRCVSKSEEKITKPRATAYEALAKFFLFPCKFDSFGCTRILKFDEAKEHEPECQFRTRNCLVNGCKDKIIFTQIYHHFITKHMELRRFSYNFPISSNQTDEELRFVILNKQFYIVKIVRYGKSREKQQKRKLFLISFNKGPEIDKFFNLKIKGKESIMWFTLDNNKVVTFDHLDSMKETSSDKAYCAKFDLDALERVFKTGNFIMELNIVQAAPKEKPLKSLEDLECLVCNEFMKPPIYNCKIGHSVCSQCKPRLKECPTCRSTYEGSRNFALENLSSLV